MQLRMSLLICWFGVCKNKGERKRKWGNEEGKRSERGERERHRVMDRR